MNSAHRRLEIVNAAFDCIAKTGHLSTSTTELAYKVGISQPAIFRHFRSKQQLHQAILDEANQRVIEELKQNIGNSESWNNPLVLLRQIIIQMGRSFEREPGVWLTLICQRSIAAEAEITEQRAGISGNKDAIAQLGFALERLGNAAIDNKQVKMNIRSADLSKTCLSVLFGMGQLWLNSDCDFDLCERLDFSIRGIVAGYLATAESERDIPMSAIA
ncbi:TetR/AcrR family transcriptional regulator [uncultured Cohaesibacter sp.]|uniref:TetR/AcrR family transcriptional regulator n=1 Tax=uncultured Cohaesibacter sp. TaxID=1002546 RepID=UPI0029C6CD51|nr:TetR/AcrR family transcriptional regulator [uncultured Cohaesibacter sp.]